MKKWKANKKGKFVLKKSLVAFGFLRKEYTKNEKEKENAYGIDLLYDYRIFSSRLSMLPFLNPMAA